MNTKQRIIITKIIACSKRNLQSFTWFHSYCLFTTLGLILSCLGLLLQLPNCIPVSPGIGIKIISLKWNCELLLPEHPMAPSQLVHHWASHTLVGLIPTNPSLTHPYSSAPNSNSPYSAYCISVSESVLPSSLSQLHPARSSKHFLKGQLKCLLYQNFLRFPQFWSECSFSWHH